MSVLAAPTEQRSWLRAFRGPLVSVLSVAIFLLIWLIAAQIAQSRLLPGPGAVLHYMVNETLHGDMLAELGITLWRVVASFVVAMLIGSVIGLALGHSPALDRALDPWLIVLLNLPALVIIILAYVWFGLNEAAAIGAVALNKIPNVVVTLREGGRALDPGLDEMARAYRMPPMVKFANVALRHFPDLEDRARGRIAWPAERRRFRAPSQFPTLQRDGNSWLHLRLCRRHARHRISIGTAP